MNGPPPQKREESALNKIRNECRRASRLSVKMLELTGLYETGEAEFVPVEVQMNQFLEAVKKTCYLQASGEKNLS